MCATEKDTGSSAEDNVEVSLTDTHFPGNKAVSGKVSRHTLQPQREGIDPQRRIEYGTGSGTHIKFFHFLGELFNICLNYSIFSNSVNRVG